VRAGDRLYDEATLDRDANPGALERLRGVAELAREWGLGISQLALAYMLSLPGMGPAIPSVSSVEQLELNAAAGKLQLSIEQRTRLAERLAVK
jgi:aryl-alcohol dehydrogenase-like predicted oxidoreductase